MMTQDLTLALPAHLVAELQRLARDRGDGVDRFVRAMLDREVMHLRSAQAAHQRRTARLARLQHLLTPVIATARDWGDLQARLALIGFELRPEGAAIALHDRATGEWLCRGADLGIAYPLLMRRFGGPLPEAANDNASPVAEGATPVA